MAPDPRPLLASFPGLARTLAPEPLCQLPTPVEPLPGLGAQAWVKRDDRCAAPYGGNKMRKLEFILPDIRRQGARRVITLGATGTNAGVAAALMCQQAGLECLIHTFPQPETETVRANQARMVRAGARFAHHGSLLAAALAWQLGLGRLSRNNYYLYAGCSNPPATFGYVNAAMELAEQVRAGQCPAPTRIVVAAGSGATVAGLAAGCALALPDTRIIAVQVAPARLGPFAVCHPATVDRMLQRAWHALRQEDPGLPAKPADNWTWTDRYFGAGYGVTDRQTDQALEQARASGLALEATYTGKAFRAFMDELGKAEGPILFWNTFNSQPG